MVRSTGAQIGLLAFTVAIVAGLYAGNSPAVVLTRGLVAMLVGAVVGQLAAWAAKLILRDYLQKRKLEIDREHVAAVRKMLGESDEDPEPAKSEPIEVG